MPTLTQVARVAQHVAGHLGELHGYERLLVALVALGPFLVLGVVVAVVRRRDVAAQERPGPDVSGPDVSGPDVSGPDVSGSASPGRPHPDGSSR